MMKTIQTGVAGLAAVEPSIIYIDTDNTIAEVTTAGYLNDAKSEGFNFSNTQVALVSTQAAGVYSSNFYHVSIVHENVSLVAI